MKTFQSMHNYTTARYQAYPTYEVCRLCSLNLSTLNFRAHSALWWPLFFWILRQKERQCSTYNRLVFTIVPEFAANFPRCCNCFRGRLSQKGLKSLNTTKTPKRRDFDWTVRNAETASEEAGNPPHSQVTCSRVSLMTHGVQKPTTTLFLPPVASWLLEPSPMDIDVFEVRRSQVNQLVLAQYESNM